MGIGIYDLRFGIGQYQEIRSGRENHCAVQQATFGTSIFYEMNPEQLSDRLVAFSISILAAVKEMQGDRICNPLADQIVRSATSSSLNYGEARSAESKKDFIHKLSVVLKELRETENSLKILCGHGCIPASLPVQKECSELIAIFIASINTAKGTQ